MKGRLRTAAFLLVVLPLLLAAGRRLEGGGTGAVVAGVVTNPEGRPLSGLVLLEKGKLYNDNFVRGGRVDERGTFAVTVEEGGDYGLHVYSEGYIYHPEAIKVVAGKVNDFKVLLPRDGNQNDNPRINKVTFTPDPPGEASSVRIQVEVTDPDGNLGPQILAVNTVTGEGLIMTPPRKVRSPKDNYPAGSYTLEYQVKGPPVDKRSWFFVVADHQCNVSNIVSTPSLPRGAAEAPPAVAAAPEAAKRTAAERGTLLFQANCSICHLPDKKEVKIGPGLQGVLKSAKLPATGLAATEENVRNRLKKGGEKMPPFGHLSDDQVSDLIAFLKSL